MQLQNIGYETVIFQVFIMEEIRKVKYKLYDEGMIESEHRGFPRAFRISQKGLLSLNP